MGKHFSVENFGLCVFAFNKTPYTFYLPHGLDLKNGDNVIVTTQYGAQIAKFIDHPKALPDFKVTQCIVEKIDSEPYNAFRDMAMKNYNNSYNTQTTLLSL